MRRLRQWLWYERGEGFAERGLWRPRSVASVKQSALCGFPVVFLLAGSMVSFSLPLSRVALHWVPGVLLLAAIPTYLLMNRVALQKDRNAKLSVVEKRGFVCPRCLYDLRGAAAISACPECGQSVDLEKLPRQWARTVRGLRYPDGDREAVTGWRDV